MPFDGTKPTTDADLLRKAKSYIDHPDKWLQGAFLQGGRQCAVGALHRALTGRVSYGPEETPELRWLCHKIVRVQAVRSIFERAVTDVCVINNVSTHDELMAIFDKTIANEEGN